MKVDLSDRLSGAVWGHLVGDAMGVPYEFGPAIPAAAVRWGERAAYRPQPPGTWSDDGGLMLALLDSLLEAGFDCDDQAQRALAWWRGPEYKPGPLFDIGLITRESLERIRTGTPPEQAGATGEHENGNGSLMRILPIALAGSEATDAGLVDQAIRASSLTHRHPRSTMTCAVYVLAARELLRGRDNRSEALDHAFTAVASCVGGAETAELALLKGYAPRTGSGYVVDCFWSAWDAFSNADSFEGTVRNAISYGNDTDTTAAVAGGLAGIYWGVSGIPPDWLAGMQGAEIVDRILKKLPVHTHRTAR